MKQSLSEVLTKNLTAFTATLIIVLSVVTSGITFFGMSNLTFRETEMLMNVLENELIRGFEQQYSDLEVMKELFERGMLNDGISYYYGSGIDAPFNRIDIVSKEGILIREIPDRGIRQGFDLSGNRTYQSISTSQREVVVGTMDYDPQLQTNVFSMAISAGEVYMIGYFSTDRIDEVWKQLDIQRGHVAVAESSGKYVAHSNRRMVDEQRTDPFVRGIAQDSVAYRQIIQYEGRPYLIFYRHEPQQGLYLLYYQDMGRYLWVLLISAGAALLMLLVFIPVSLHIIRRVTRNVQNSLDGLVVSSQDIAQGIYALPSKEADYSEFQVLMDNFVEMGRQVEKREEDIGALSDELENNYYMTVVMMANAIEAKDRYTGNHCERVRDFSLMIGEGIGLGPEELHELKYGSTLHDIGKIGIPEAILNKPGRLTEEEYSSIKEHSRIGYDIIRELPGMSMAKDIILSHHESYDGTGYPQGLKGKEIPLLARIVTIADAFDAMTSKRAYRAGTMTEAIAIEELQRCSGNQFDPELVRVFVKIIMDAA